MATIQHYIQELLFERDCVVVPDFGGFITNFQSAKLDRSLNFISPAKRWVAFNSLLKNDDGLLSHFIAKSEGISVEETTIKIRAFVDALKFRLRNSEQVYLEHIGFFELNKENKLVFTPLSEQNYCSDSFGLSTVHIYPKRNQEIESPQVESKTKLLVFRGADRAAERVVKTSKKTAATAKKLVPFMTGVATAVLLGIGILSYEEQNSLSTMNPFVGITARKPVPAPIIETKSRFETLSKDIQPSQDSIATSSGNSDISYTNKGDYFVIVGSFGSEANAQKFVKELQLKGFSNATVIEPEKKGKLIKVAANAYHNENEAYTQSTSIKSKLRASAWIFKSSKKQ